MIVKDADKLWRYSSSGFYIDIERFGESYKEGLERLRCNISGIISILELILLRSRGNAKKVKIFQQIFHPVVDYVF